MRHTTFLFFICLSYASVAMPGFDFDSLFSQGGGDPFAGFDFGGGGGLFAQDNPWGGDMFGGGNLWGNDASFDGLFEQPLPEAVEPANAAGAQKDKGIVHGSPQKVFLSSYEKEAALPVHYKDAARTILSGLVATLHAVRDGMSSLNLGIAAKERLAPLLPPLTQAITHLELVQSRSPYMKALYRKEFSGARTSMANLKPSLSFLVSQLEGVVADHDSLDVPTKLQRYSHEATLQEVERAIENDLAPVNRSLAKIIAHDVTKKGLEEKTQKNARRESEARSRHKDSSSWGSHGGDSWGDSWSDDSFSDGWSQPAVQAGGWSDAEGSFWDDGGDDWGSDWGSGWHGGSSGGSYHSRAASSSSSSPQQTSSQPEQSRALLIGNGAGPAQENDASPTSRNTSVKKQKKDMRAQHFLLEAESTVKNLHAWEKAYTAAADKEAFVFERQKDTTVLRTLERVRVCGALLSNLKAYPSALWEDTHDDRLSVLQRELAQAAPLIIALCKDAPPVLSRLKAEVDKKQKGASADDAKRAAEEEVAVRKKIQQVILLLLKDMRENDMFAARSFFNEALVTYDREMLTRLQEVFDAAEKLPALGHAELEKLTRFSQSLLAQPTAVSYVKGTADGLHEEELASFARIRSKMGQLLHDKFALKAKAYDLLHDALRKIGEKMDKKSADIRDKKFIDAVSAQLALVLETEQDENKGVLRRMLLPFSVERLRHISLDYKLVTNLKVVWQKELEAAEELSDASPAPSQKMKPSQVQQELAELKKKKLVSAPTIVEGQKPLQAILKEKVERKEVESAE